MNDEKIKIRGFCNHESFGGVGMAIPDRINLFRAQALRSVGGNGWRMSHNPVSIGLLDVLDRVGVVAMEESRIMGTDDVSIMNMGASLSDDSVAPLATENGLEDTAGMLLPPGGLPRPCFYYYGGGGIPAASPRCGKPGSRSLSSADVRAADDVIAF